MNGADLRPITWQNIEIGTWRIETLEKLSPSELLGVPIDAPYEMIREAYRRKATLYHPDHVDQFFAAYSEEVMKLINRAYDALTNPRH